MLKHQVIKFQIRKSGQILGAHKPYFLMPGHICNYTAWLTFYKTFIHILWFVALDWHVHMFWLKLNGPLMCLM